jgi:hypothetical protein
VTSIKDPLSERYEDIRRSLEELCNRTTATLEQAAEQLQEAWPAPFPHALHLAKTRLNEILEEFPSPEDHTEMLEILSGIWAWSDPGTALGGLEWLHHAIRDRKKRAKDEESGG